MAITLNGTTGVTTTGLTSNGIDDNATSTAMTLDTSGNVLVGKTSASSTTAGFQASQDGQTAINRSGTALQVGRLSTDGSIIDLRKDGTTVGSIGVQSTDQLYIGTPDGNGVGIVFDGDNRKIDPTNGSGSNLDAAVDLGNGSHRFKDLYLSGGVYLGGTGAANKLDDYEEGTWTPTLAFNNSNVGITYNTTYTGGFYVKVGDIVHVSGYIILQNKGSSTGNARILGLPITPSTNNYNYIPVNWWIAGVTFTGVPQFYLQPSTGQIVLGDRDTSGSGSAITDADFSNTSEVMVQLSYRA